MRRSMNLSKKLIYQVHVFFAEDFNIVIQKVVFKLFREEETTVDSSKLITIYEENFSGINARRLNLDFIHMFVAKFIGCQQHKMCTFSLSTDFVDNVIAYRKIKLELKIKHCPHGLS